MKIKEKIFAGIKHLQGSERLEQLKQSAAARYLQKFLNVCRGNLFLTQIVLTLLYRLALDVVYLLSLSPLYAYSGFTTDFSLLRYTTSLLALLVFVPFIVRLLHHRTSSSILITFLNYLYFIPLTSYCGCKESDVQYLIIALLYWMFLFLFQFKIPVLQLTSISDKCMNPLIKLLTVGSVAFVFFISGKYTGFRFTLNFLDVYGIRAEAATYALPTLFSYGLSMMSIVLAILLLHWLIRKNYAVVGILCITYLFLFSIAAHKSIFFFLFLTLGSYLLYRKWMLRWLPGFFFLVAGAGLIEHKLIGTFYIISLFLRRMMYIPVDLGNRYLQFFTENTISLFEDSIMGKFSFDGMYSTSIARLLGEFAGQSTNNANNGLLGDMFANLPIEWGILLMPFLLILCFRLLDFFAANISEKYLLPVCVFFANGFMNGSWSTVLLSHGFLIACLLLYIFPKEEISPK